MTKRNFIIYCDVNFVKNKQIENLLLQIPKQDTRLIIGNSEYTSGYINSIATKFEFEIITSDKLIRASRNRTNDPSFIFNSYDIHKTIIFSDAIEKNQELFNLKQKSEERKVPVYLIKSF